MYSRTHSQLFYLEPINTILRLLYWTLSKPVQAFGLTFRNPVRLSALGFVHVKVGE